MKLKNENQKKKKNPSENVLKVYIFCPILNLLTHEWLQANVHCTQLHVCMFIVLIAKNEF